MGDRVTARFPASPVQGATRESVPALGLTARQIRGRLRLSTTKGTMHNIYFTLNGRSCSRHCSRKDRMKVWKRALWERAASGLETIIIHGG